MFHAKFGGDPTIYQSLLSRSEFQEGQVPLKATGSCSWCWKDSFHIQRLVNIVDLKVSVSNCGKNSAIVVDGEQENEVEVGEGAMVVYAEGVGRGISKRYKTGPHLLLLNTITILGTHVLISCPQSAHVAPSSPRRIPLLAACPAPSSASAAPLATVVTSHADCEVLCGSSPS